MEKKCIFQLKIIPEYQPINALFRGYCLTIFEDGQIILSIELPMEITQSIGCFPEMAKNIMRIIESHSETLNELKDFYYSEGWTNETFVNFNFGDIQIKSSDICRHSDKYIEDIRITNAPNHEKYIEDIIFKRTKCEDKEFNL